MRDSVAERDARACATATTRSAVKPTAEQTCQRPTTVEEKKGTSPIATPTLTPACGTNDKALATSITTVLFRPIEGGRFTKENKLSIAKDMTLTAKWKITECRVNTRLSIAAVDTFDADAVEALLQTTTLADIKVKACLPVPQAQSCGLVKRLPPAVTTEELKKGLDSPSEIINIQRLGGGKVAMLHFDGPLPTHVTLWGVRKEVAIAEPRPFQCSNCGRLGHVSAACILPDGCPTCTGRHPKGACDRKDTPKCPNCPYLHDAFDRRCPAYQREKNIAIRAANNGGDWAEARAAEKARREEQRRQQEIANLAAGRRTKERHNGPLDLPYLPRRTPEGTRNPKSLANHPDTKEIKKGRQSCTRAPELQAQQSSAAQTPKQHQQQAEKQVMPHVPKYRRTYGPKKPAAAGEIQKALVAVQASYVTSLSLHQAQSVESVARALSTVHLPLETAARSEHLSHKPKQEWPESKNAQNSSSSGPKNKSCLSPETKDAHEHPKNPVGAGQEKKADVIAQAPPVTSTDTQTDLRARKPSKVRKKKSKHGKRHK
uniref:Putative tick transposon n=1 Tax=Ixodes ricinus TaxID=34613 RepID=A0A147BMC9_IXORI